MQGIRYFVQDDRQGKGSGALVRDGTEYRMTSNMWNKVIGHDRQIDALRRSLAEGRPPHAWLFSGIRGIGKRLVAQTLAAAICCRGSNSPCGLCTSCTKVINNVHPDVLVVEPEGQRLKIDQVRTLARKIQFHPLESDAKVAVIDEADSMTEAAANSLLKILEEPPSATHFILITSAAHRLLPTIRSRCRHVTFLPLNDTVVADYLQRLGGWQPDEARRVATLAQGSLGLARQLTPEFITEVLGQFEALMGHSRPERFTASAADIIATSEAWAGEAPRASLILDLLTGWYRDRLRAAVREGEGESKMRRLLDNLQRIASARDMADTTANKQLMFEQLLFSVTGI